MKMLLVLLLMGLGWIAGYYCGQASDDGDLLGWVRTQSDRLQESSITETLSEAMRSGQREILAIAAGKAVGESESAVNEAPSSPGKETSRQASVLPGLPECW